MSTPSTTLPRTSIEAEDTPADDGLALLLDLFALEPVAEPERRPAGRHRATPRARLQDWTRRAALWGAGPGGVRRAW
ncbi:hypothetical protein [Geodermatophilus chilensis]|uniref:hypothetical protein n=1 Tax=Geodermatophilus chilensis TaxID=2035835 RepID=UPI000C265027|nr:hypothetical protein [Geodermatophilus chilensis]